MIRTGDVLQEFMATSIIWAKNIQLSLCTYLNSHLLGAPREYVLHGLDPGLNWASRWFPFPNILLVCSGPPSVLLFAQMDQVSHSASSLLTGWLLTNVQVNNMAALHDTCTDTHAVYTSHYYYYSFSSLYFFHSLWHAGWLRPFPSDTVRVTKRCVLQNRMCYKTVHVTKQYV
jgi:hypothetical protein